ncbi:MAG: hypothetical protein WKF67_14000 [Rubrobacteraceae bacterium]
MSEDTHVIRPTVLVRLDEEEGTLGVVTSGKGEEEALIVFRGPEDAWAFQERNGRYSAAEGFSVIGMEPVAVSALLDKQGLGNVALPEEWTGTGGVDRFSAANFLELLDTAEIVG